MCVCVCVRQLFHKVSISKALRFGLLHKSQSNRVSRKDGENKSGWHGNGLGLWVSEWASYPIIYIAFILLLCLHMARISQTVNLNNFSVAPKKRSSDEIAGAREMLVLMIGISIIYSRKNPDKMDELLTFCWKSHRIIWHFAWLLLYFFFCLLFLGCSWWDTNWNMCSECEQKSFARN